MVGISLIACGRHGEAPTDGRFPKTRVGDNGRTYHLLATMAADARHMPAPVTATASMRGLGVFATCDAANLGELAGTVSIRSGKATQTYLMVCGTHDDLLLDGSKTSIKVTLTSLSWVHWEPIDMDPAPPPPPPQPMEFGIYQWDPAQPAAVAASATPSRLPNTMPGGWKLIEAQTMPWPQEPKPVHVPADTTYGVAVICPPTLTGTSAGWDVHNRLTSVENGRAFLRVECNQPPWQAAYCPKGNGDPQFCGERTVTVRPTVDPAYLVPGGYWSVGIYRR
jgi:hypothetical protein